MTPRKFGRNLPASRFYQSQIAAKLIKVEPKEFIKLHSVLNSLKRANKPMLNLNNRGFTQIVGIIALLFASHAFALENAVNTGRLGDTAIRGYDVVAYFTENTAVKGSSKFKFNWRGANWQFSSETNLNAFKAEPLKYAPQYGGWCAYAMSDQGRTVRVDPEAWTIIDNKLYLNFNKKVRKVWLEDVEANIKQADGFYPKTTDVNEWLERENTN